MSESYARSELRKIAPWVDLELRKVRPIPNRNDTRPMHEWVRMIEQNHSALWRAMDAQG